VNSTSEPTNSAGLDPAEAKILEMCGVPAADYLAKKGGAVAPKVN
jgi:hypothetical protein